jgi:nucleoside-diphosphate-sugar epimerase
VRALVRSPQAALAARGAELWRGDLLDPGSLTGIGEGLEVVFHAAAQLNLPGVDARTFFDTNLQGTRNLVGALHASSLQRFVALSSVAAIGLRDAGLIDERFPCRPDLPYGQSKLAVDRFLERAARERGLPVVILRPPTVYGPGERYNFLALCRAIRSGRFLHVGPGENRIDFCWVQNLVEALTAAAARGRNGETYLVADQPPLSFRQTTRTLAELLGARPPSPLYLPVPVAYAIAYPLQLLGAVLGRPVPLFPSRVRTMASDLCFDVSKAREELGFAPRGPFRELAGQTVRWYVEQGLLP